MADLLYKKQQHVDELFDFDSFYNKQPYTSGPAKPKTYEEGIVDNIRTEISTYTGRVVDFFKQNYEVDALARWVLKKTMKDLPFTMTTREKSVTGRRRKEKRCKPEECCRTNWSARCCR